MRTEEQLQASDEKVIDPVLSQAFDLLLQAPVLTCVLKGRDHVIHVANQAVKDFWGKAEPIVGRQLLEVLPELQGQGFIELLDRVSTSGKPHTAREVPVMLNRNFFSEIRYFDFIYHPFSERQGGETSGVFIVAHDVTEQVLSNRNLRESEEKYRSLFERMDQGFCVLEMIFDTSGEPVDYKFLELNPVFEKQTGLHDALGKTALQLVPNLEKHWIELYGNVALTGQSTRFVERSEAMGRWFEVNAFRIGGDDSRKVALLFSDITRRRQVEDELEQKVKERTAELVTHRNLVENILKNSSNGISVTEMIRDASGKVVDASTILANDAAVNFIGLPRDLFLSKTAVELDPEILNSAYGQTCLKTLETGEPSLIQYQLELTRRWLELTISKLDDNHLIHIFTDVTPIKTAQLQLEQTVQELQRSNANLEEFAYAASHDLKEPIRKILFFADRIRATLHGKLGEPEHRLFQRLEEATVRMRTLIDDLLSFSQLSSTTRPLDKVDLNHVMDLVLNDLEIEISEKNAEIHVGRLFTVNGHQRQLQQAFQNLISNALKYSKPGVQPQINIMASDHVPGSADGNTLRSITITDNGIGFEQKESERIFTVFTRLHGNDEYRGTGIGLSIVRKVIENHKGSITATGEPGGGAAFTVCLPEAN
jgi:PAS domain S-box-containing protein